MQFASESSERLMLRPSRRRWPVLSVLYARSEPARSIIERRADCFLAERGSVNLSTPTQLICMTACEREEASLQLVDSVVR